MLPRHVPGEILLIIWAKPIRLRTSSGDDRVNGDSFQDWTSHRTQNVNHLPSKKEKTKANARFPETIKDSWRQKGTPPSSKKRSVADYAVGMLPQVHRLRRDLDFRRVFRTGKRVETKHLAGTVAKGLTPHARVAVIVSANVIKNATGRNYWKRKIREAARKILPEIEESHDLVITLKAAPERTPHDTVSGELQTLLKKAHIL